MFFGFYQPVTCSGVLRLAGCWRHLLPLLATWYIASWRDQRQRRLLAEPAAFEAAQIASRATAASAQLRSLS